MMDLTNIKNLWRCFTCGILLLYSACIGAAGHSESLLERLQSSDDKIIKKAAREVYSKRYLSGEVLDQISALLQEYEQADKHIHIIPLLVKIQLLGGREQDFLVIDKITKKLTDGKLLKEKNLKEAEQSILRFRSKRFSEKYRKIALNTHSDDSHLSLFYLALLSEDSIRVQKVGAMKLLRMGVWDEQTLEGVAEYLNFFLNYNIPEAQRTFIVVLLKVIAESGDIQYLPLFDKVPTQSSSIQFKNNIEKYRALLVANKNRPKFRTQTEIDGYFIKEIKSVISDPSYKVQFSEVIDSGIRNKELWQLVATQLQEEFKQLHAVSAWYAKALSSSGYLEFKEILESAPLLPLLSELKPGDKPENYLPSKIGRHIAITHSKLNAYHGFYKIINDIRSHSDYGTEQERIFLALLASPDSKTQAIAVRWLRKNRFNKPLGLTIVAEVLLYQFSDSAGLHKRQIGNGEHMAAILKKYGTEDHLEILKKAITPLTARVMTSRIRSAIQAIEKRGARQQ